MFEETELKVKRGRVYVERRKKVNGSLMGFRLGGVYLLYHKGNCEARQNKGHL